MTDTPKPSENNLLHDIATDPARLLDAVQEVDANRNNKLEAKEMLQWMTDHAQEISVEGNNFAQELATKGPGAIKWLNKEDAKAELTEDVNSLKKDVQHITQAFRSALELWAAKMAAPAPTSSKETDEVLKKLKAYDPSQIETPQLSDFETFISELSPEAEKNKSSES